MQLDRWLFTLALIGCKSEATCVKDTDCKGDRVCTSSACVDKVATSASSVPRPTLPRATLSGDGDEPQPDDTPPRAAGDPSDTCGAAVASFYRVLNATGTPEEKAAFAPESESLAHCREHHWPAALMECARTMTTVAEWQTKCFKAAFSGELDLKPKRTFDAFEYANGKYAALEPAAMTLDGDWMPGGDGCGSMTKTSGPAHGAFIVCAGSVVAGPLTTVAEIKAVYAERAKQSRDAFELGRRIRANWPTGCSNCRYRVYDQNGNHLRDE